MFILSFIYNIVSRFKWIKKRINILVRKEFLAFILEREQIPLAKSKDHQTLATLEYFPTK